VGELEQRLQEAEATIAARSAATADSPPPHLQESRAAWESSQSLLEELAAANEELRIQAGESQAQAEELVAQAEELEMQRDELQFVNRELEGERALLRTVLEQMPAGLIIAAPSGKLLLGNPQMEAILGRPLSQDDCLEHYALFLGRHGEGSPLAREDYPLACCLTRGERVSEEDLEFLRSDGSLGVVRVNAAPVRNRQGEIIAGVATYRDVTGRKQREREIQRLASFPQLNPNPILEVDTSGRITYFNQAAREVVAGLGPPAKLSDLLPADLKQILLDIKRTGQANFQREVQVKDAVYLQSISCVEPFQTIRLYGVDISKRKRSEAGVLQANEEWERTFEAVPDLIAILDTDHHLVRVNRAMAAALGEEPQELAGKPCYELIHRSTCPPDVCPHSLLLQDGQGHTAEIREFDRDFLVTTSPLVDDKGQLMGCVHVARDITERKRAEEALSRLNEELEQRVQERTGELRQAVAQLREEVIQRQEAEEDVRVERQRFYQVLDRMPAMVMLVSADCKLTYVNQELIRRYGEPGFRHCYEFFFGLDAPCESCKTLPVIQAQTPVDWEWQGPDGKYYHAYDYPFVDVDGSHLVLSMKVDITARKAAEEEVRKLNQELEDRVKERTVQLLAANREMEAFAYSVSHDLKAPIRAIDGFSRMLMLEHAARLDGEGLRLLEVVRRNTAFMAHLIDDLLALSRLGRHEVRKAHIDLTPVVTGLIKELRAAEPDRPLELKIKELPPAFGDASLLRQVLANLLANAFKFTRLKEKAIIEVGGESVAGETIYYVKDNGIGFDMRYRDKLFGVFQRLHPIGEFEGTGVGLAIVQRILQRHDGRVWAEGKVNEGATFFFALPAEADNP
jgi:PAS domain S-box-containing protein